MTTTVGRVNFTARLDGRGTERDAENIGRQAGAAAGEGYDKTWSRSFRDSLTREGKAAVTRMGKDGGDAGTAFGKAVKDRLDFYLKDARKSFDSLRIDEGFLDNFAAGFADAGLAAGKLQEQIVTLRQQNQISEAQFESARKKIDAWAESQRSAAISTNDTIDANERSVVAMDAVAKKLEQDRRARENVIATIREHNYQVLQQSSVWKETEVAAGGLTAKMDRMAGTNADLSFRWKDLSHNTRQWTLIISTVAAGMQDIAVLGSAAGAGLVALGGAATSGIIGLGGVASVFVTLNKDLEKLPDNLRPVAAEFQRFTPIFSELRETISSSAFQQMGGVFDTLGRSVQSLSPEFSALGAEIGRTFQDFAKGTKQGSAGLEEIRKSVALAGPNFRSMAGAVGDLGVALLRSFNGAQPLVEDLIQYVQRLADQFDAFTRSDSFGLWLANAQRIFSSLGPLIDAVGRSLNDLVTPAAVERTAAFMDNLTGFIPNLTLLLDALGGLDVFGLAAQLLNDFGVALQPLAGPVADLGLALSGVLSGAIEQVAEGLGVVAAAIAPTVQAFADLLSALPPDAIAGMANGVLVLAGAFVVLKGAQGISGVIDSLFGLGSIFDATAGRAGKLGNALGNALGKAGMAGLAVGGALALVKAVEGIARAIDDTEDKARNLAASNATIAESFDTLNGVADGLMPPLTDIQGVMEKLGSVGNPFENFALAFSETGAQALALSGTLKELDAPIASLAQQNLPAAQKQFSAWAEELGATDAQVLTMIGSMDGFKQALIDQAGVLGIAATDANLVALAMGEIGPAATAAAGSFGEVATASGITQEAIAGLSDKITGFASTVYGSRDAAREYEASLDALTESIALNGSTLDITTEAGRANQEAVDALAQSILDNTSKTLENTKSTEAATGVMAAGRDELVRMLQQFNMTEDEAKAYADQLGLIPENVYTEAELTGVADAEAQLAQLARNRTAYITAVVDRSAENDFYGSGGVNRPGYASGGVLYGPTNILAGEAGPEAIVPLNRPLSQVDESVRWLAAIAQGKTAPAMANGGVVAAGRTVNIDAGAIVVYDSGDAGATANEVLRQLTERLNG